MRKSSRAVNAAICFGLLMLFFSLGRFIVSPFATSFDEWLSLTFLIAILLGTQSLMHLFITRMQLQHSLSWQVFSVLACVLMWIYLLLYRTSPEITAQAFMLEMLKSFAALLVAHGIVLGDYLLTKRLMSQEETSVRS